MSVQAVIAQLNQQSNSTDIQPNYKRSSSRLNNNKNELTPLRSRFNNNNNDNEFLKKAAASLKEVNTTKSLSNNNRSSSLSEKVFNTEINHHKKDLPLTFEKMKIQLEKITLERDSLKQQLNHCQQSSNTPSSNSHDHLWFEIDENNENDYEDEITQYYQSCSNQQYRQQIDQLKRQLAACEIGTQWMMGKYIGELERERLHTKSLKTIVQSQEALINTMENNYKSNNSLSNSLSTTSMNSIHSSLSSTNNNHYQQQYFLLRSQVDLQKMELDDKQDMIQILMNEREYLLKKLNNKSPSYNSMKRRSRVISSSSSSSSDSMNQQQQQLPYHILTSSSSPIRPYSPPHTPPPFDRLPALPTSTSISSNLSSTSSTPITPPSSQRPSMITFDHKPIVHEYENEHVDHVDHLQHPQRYSSLLHKSSMPDIRSIHYSALNSPRSSLGSHPSMDPYLLSKKSLSRQRSFWKGWKQRLSN